MLVIKVRDRLLQIQAPPIPRPLHPMILEKGEKEEKRTRKRNVKNIRKRNQKRKKRKLMISYRIKK